MASNFKLAVPPRNAALQALINQLASGSEDWIACEIRTGLPPTNLSDAATGTSLVFLQNTAAGIFSTPTAGATTVTFAGTMSNSGEAGYFRLLGDSDAAPRAELQGTCGDAGDAPVDLQFNNKNLVAAGSLTISATITMPE